MNNKLAALSFVILSLAIAPAAKAQDIDDFTSMGASANPQLFDPSLSEKSSDSSSRRRARRQIQKLEEQTPDDGTQKPKETAALPGAVPAKPLPQPEVQPRIQPFISPERPKPKDGDDKASSPPAIPVKTIPAPPPPKTQAPGATVEAKDDRPVDLYIKIAVPHQQHPVDTITVYPYPVLPPKLFKEIEPLTIKKKPLKSQLMGVGYTARVRGDKPYPPCGWRFQYCLEAAVRKSGLGYPHTIVDIYRWQDEIIPWIRPEIERTNKAEDERKDRYDETVDLYKNKYQQIQSESTRSGLFAVPFRMYRKNLGYARIPAGTWWVAGSRRVPGLFYYWEIPITVVPGAMLTLTLNEQDALAIQGGW